MSGVVGPIEGGFGGSSYLIEFPCGCAVGNVVGFGVVGIGKSGVFSLFRSSVGIAIEAEIGEFFGFIIFIAYFGRNYDFGLYGVGSDGVPIGDGGGNYDVGFVESDIEDVVVAGLGDIFTIVTSRCVDCGADLGGSDVVDAEIGTDASDYVGIATKI